MAKREPPILATPANMRAYGGPSVVAYDRWAHAEYSATAGDYFMRPDDAPLRGMFGRPLILVRRASYLVAVGAK